MEREEDRCEPGPMEDEITVTVAARISGYSQQHCRLLAREGKIRARKLGPRIWLLSAESLLEHKARMTGPGGA